MFFYSLYYYFIFFCVLIISFSYFAFVFFYFHSNYFIITPLLCVQLVNLFAHEAGAKAASIECVQYSTDAAVTGLQHVDASVRLVSIIGVFKHIHGHVQVSFEKSHAYTHATHI